MTDANSGGFARQVARSFLITGLGNGLTKILNVAALFVVLKLISPDELGVATIVLAVFGILQSLTELGLGAALVQAKDPTREQIDSLFWISLGLSAVLYLVVLAGAPLIAWFYEEPDLVPLLRVQALAVLLFSFYLVPRNLMTRDLWFGRLAVVDNVSLLISSAGMVWLAWAGYGAWAIIWSEVGNRAGQLVLCQVFRPHLPRLRVRLSEVRAMIDFGLYATGSRFLYNFYINADYLIVGKLFGADVVGVYSLAFRIVSDPVRTLTSIVNQVAYPTFAKLQDQRERLARYYFAIARANMAFIGVALVAICVFIEDVLVIAEYTQWLPAVPLVQAFSLFGLVRCVSPLVPQLLNAVGQARLSFFYSLAGAFWMPLGFYLGALYGDVMGVAWAWGIFYPALVLFVFWFGARVLDRSLMAFTWGSLSGALVLIPVAAIAVAARYGLIELSAIPVLASTILGVLLTAVAGLAFGIARERETLRAVLGRRTTKKEPAR